jgi:hypothetical protein
VNLLVLRLVRLHIRIDLEIAQILCAALMCVEIVSFPVSFPFLGSVYLRVLHLVRLN